MMQSISDFCPPGVEAGVGLALQDDKGRYLFFIAGTRHHCPAGERFYAGIGGHREPGEDWLACAHREALEETGTDIEILSAPATWHIPHHRPARQVEVTDRPRPLALYEMIHPPEDEVLAIIALTREQVIRGPERKPALAELFDEGAQIVASAAPVDGGTCLYPLGTACALACVLGHMPGPLPARSPLSGVP